MNTVLRTREVDIIRMAALVGICIVNIPFIALPLDAVFSVPNSTQDKLAVFVVEAFFQLKFFILFSFIFGWGIAIQQCSAKAKGQPFTQHHFRRMAALSLLGFAHATLVFSGDILLLYALLGCLLWLIKDFTIRQLMIVAGWMLPLSMLCLLVLGIMIDAVVMNSGTLSSAVGVGLAGSFKDATQARIADWPATFAFLILLQGPLAFGAFAAGLAAAKANFFTANSAGYTWLRRRFSLLLFLALPANVFYAAVMGGFISESYVLLTLAGFVIVALAAPAMSLVYLFIFICIARAIKIPQLFVLAGQNTLSCYIIQGVIAGWFFGGYGLGLHARYGQATLLLIAVAIAVTAMLVVGTYAKRFGRGPLEPLLRRMSGD